jgi:ABC-type amino acid transport substrate-binding protein
MRLIILALVTFLAFPLAAKADAVYDRVMASSTLRCGYMLYPPYMDKDPNTGSFSGVAYDFVMALAKQVNLKVEWVEEVPIGQEPAALAANRIDAVCASTGSYNPDFFMRVDMTDPMFYVRNDIYARADDARFKGPIVAGMIDKDNVTFAAIDGDSTAVYPALIFPHAKQNRLTALSSPAQLFQEILGHKADLVMAETAVATNATKANPAAFIRLDWQGPPLPHYGLAIAIRKDADQLLRSLNETIEFMNANGTIDTILDKHDPGHQALIPVPKPYQQRWPFPLAGNRPPEAR